MVRRIILHIFFSFVLMSFAVSAHAAPAPGVQSLMALDNSKEWTLNIGENTYTIANRADVQEDENDVTYNDVYNGTYLGYEPADNDSSYSYSGYYLGTITEINGQAANDDDIATLRDLVQYYFFDESYVVEYVDKFEEGDTDRDIITTFVIDENTGNTTGTWSLESEEETSLALEFYVVKAANEFALYYMDPAQTHGDWWTGHLLTPNEKNIPAISHFSVYDMDGPEPPGDNNPVPEPATLLLFGTGALGLAGVCRKKLKK